MKKVKMTNEEALEALKGRYADKSWIDILDQVQDTSVWQKAIEALEKQIPKKVEFDKHYGNYICPICKTEIKFTVIDYDKAEIRYYLNYCGECGQAIDWSEEK